MLPDVSMQNTTTDSSALPPAARVAWSAGRAADASMRYVVSVSVGISSGTRSTVVLVPQNSQIQLCRGMRRKQGKIEQITVEHKCETCQARS